MVAKRPMAAHENVRLIILVLLNCPQATRLTAGIVAIFRLSERRGRVFPLGPPSRPRRPSAFVSRYEKLFCRTRRSFEPFRKRVNESFDRLRVWEYLLASHFRPRMCLLGRESRSHIVCVGS